MSRRTENPGYRNYPRIWSKLSSPRTCIWHVPILRKEYWWSGERPVDQERPRFLWFRCCKQANTPRKFGSTSTATFHGFLGSWLLEDLRVQNIPAVCTTLGSEEYFSRRNKWTFYSCQYSLTYIIQLEVEHALFRLYRTTVPVVRTKIHWTVRGKPSGFQYSLVYASLSRCAFTRVLGRFLSHLGIFKYQWFPEQWKNSMWRKYSLKGCFCLAELHVIYPDCSHQKTMTS